MWLQQLGISTLLRTKIHSRRDQLTLSPGINLLELGATFSFLTLLRRGDKVRSLVQDCLVRALRVDRTLSTWLSVGLAPVETMFMYDIG